MPEAFLTAYNFEVRLAPSGFGGDEELALASRGAFSEVSGLETSIEVVEIREGGYHGGKRKLAGPTSSGEIVLKRGLSLDKGFWTWVQRCLDGNYPLPYLDGTVLVHGPAQKRDENAAARFTFVNGLAVRVRCPDLAGAAASSLPIEELHIAHEGLRREA